MITVSNDLACYLPFLTVFPDGEDAMTRKKQGICLTCLHFAKCVLRPAECSTDGIHFCEEYMTVCLAPVVVTDEKPKNMMKRPPSGLLGLCSDCLCYPSCSFPRPEAGVWHCEDYQ